MFTWVPSIGLAGSSTWHDGICKPYTFAEAEAKGMGVADEGWTWYEKEWEVTGLDGEDLGGKGGKFTLGERDVGEIMWEVVKPARV